MESIRVFFFRGSDEIFGMVVSPLRNVGKDTGLVLYGILLWDTWRIIPGLGHVVNNHG